MNDQQIELLINMFRAKGQITDLEKDIIDTYHELKKQPVDMNSAFQQMKSNELNHPDVLLKVTMMPTTGQKQASELTVQDLQYVLSAQLTFLLEKEETSQRNGNRFVAIIEPTEKDGYSYAEEKSRRDAEP